MMVCLIVRMFCWRSGEGGRERSRPQKSFVFGCFSPFIPPHSCPSKKAFFPPQKYAETPFSLALSPAFSPYQVPKLAYHAFDSLHSCSSHLMSSTILNFPFFLSSIPSCFLCPSVCVACLSILPPTLWPRPSLTGLLWTTPHSLVCVTRFASSVTKPIPSSFGPHPP